MDDFTITVESTKQAEEKHDDIIRMTSSGEFQTMQYNTLLSADMCICGGIQGPGSSENDRRCLQEQATSRGRARNVIEEGYRKFFCVLFLMLDS